MDLVKVVIYTSLQHLSVYLPEFKSQRAIQGCLLQDLFAQLELYNFV